MLNNAVSLGTGVADVESEGWGVVDWDAVAGSLGSGVGAGDGLSDAGVFGRESCVKSQ